MARITIEDCQQRVNNRFLIVQMGIKRVHQYREGYNALLESRNKEIVTALREVAAGKVLVAPEKPKEQFDEAGNGNEAPRTSTHSF